MPRGATGPIRRSAEYYNMFEQVICTPQMCPTVHACVQSDLFNTDASLTRSFSPYITSKCGSMKL